MQIAEISDCCFEHDCSIMPGIASFVHVIVTQGSLQRPSHYTLIGWLSFDAAQKGCSTGVSIESVH